MELQFSKEVCPCLHSLVRQVQTQEQTQEIRLPEGMPDIGRVLGAWAQVLVRGKEWRGNGMNVSGGILGWALYLPEDGSEPRCVDTWIPFQMKWDFPETQRDGTIHVWPLVTGVDARCVSARKLLLRCGISIFGEAMEPSGMELYRAEQVPEDVQMLKNTYPMVLPLEAGEKQFLIQEPMEPGGDRQLLTYNMQMLPLEQRIMSNRLVFRGVAKVHCLCKDPEGKLSSCDFELPFSQFTELDGAYSDQGTACIQIIPTALELERDEDGTVQLKCAAAAQYVICDRVMVESVEDAYSPIRAVEIQMGVCKMPAQLDNQKQVVSMNAVFREGKLLDAAFYSGHPQSMQSGDMEKVTVTGQFQMLYQDEEGMLQGCTLKTETGWELLSDRNNRVQVRWQPGSMSILPGMDGQELSQELYTETEVWEDNGFETVSSLKMGEQQEPDPRRPSLILRRLGEHSLWSLAKNCGSTVDAVMEANGLSEVPEKNRILLIPVE
jgi:hypothetical protein